MTQPDGLTLCRSWGGIRTDRSAALVRVDATPGVASKNTSRRLVSALSPRGGEGVEVEGYPRGGERLEVEGWRVCVCHAPAH